MPTIIINERTKVGKTLLELAGLLALTNKGIVVDMDLPKSTIKSKELTPKQKALVNRLIKVKKNADAGLYKSQTLKSFYESL